MKPSSHSSVHATTDAFSYTYAGAYYDPTQVYLSSADYASGLYDGPSSSTGEWSTDHAGLGSCFDVDQALFEELLNAEVTSTSPSGLCTVAPMQSPPFYDQEVSFLHPPQAFSGSLPYTPTSSCARASLAFELALPVTAESYRSPDPISPPLHRAHHPEDKYSVGATSLSLRVSHRISHCSPSSSPYPSPSPEPSRHVSQWSNMPVHTAHSPALLAFEQSLSETTMACVSPDLIHPSSRHNLDDDRWTDASSQSSRASNRSLSSSPYPSHSPDLSPHTSPIVRASQRRNAPARTAAPVPAKTWQCPHCPHIQRNRRSPDLKRHIKTHTRDESVADWVCCGVPVMSATELGVPTAALREAQVFDFDGVLIIGGCRTAFSRRDALRRHLQREKGKCFGDALSLHQRGNRECR